MHRNARLYTHILIAFPSRPTTLEKLIILQSNFWHDAEVLPMNLYIQANLLGLQNPEEL